MRTRLALALLLAVAPLPLAAEVIGTMQPAAPLTEERIAQLPAAEQAAWRDYLARSVAAMARDKAVLEAERAALAEAGQPTPAPPPDGSTSGTLPLDRDPVWYGGAEARALADNVVSFQTPAGGWGKNQDRSAPPRVAGQHWIGADLKAGPYAAQDGAGGWSFVGTLDNDATVTELGLLARVQAQLPGTDGEPYRQSFRKGIAYLLAAELPGGGWPQVWPLKGGYHDALTLNDNVLVGTTALLQRVAAGNDDYAFLPADLRQQAAAAVERALAVMLDTQMEADGRPTIWAQQYDAITRQPAGARNFEPVALSTGESAAILQFLMRQPEPTPAMRTAITAGAAWFAAHALQDVAWNASDPEAGRLLIPEPGAGPLWARFYDPVTQTPIFGDRDRSIHDRVDEISRERRDGYSWYNTSGNAVARAYARWSAPG
ncbi:pectate lyase [Croceibacterium ferulae]|uniref:pectate lyase n=1 Tax=Croceibacterium ferulae TaxID=1854641 RepID=UPI001F4D6713|nr:pectate lyase [Croceibacterium ferulae]